MNPTREEIEAAEMDLLKKTVEYKRSQLRLQELLLHASGVIRYDENTKRWVPCESV
jgi:hypothetical protein